MLQLSMLSKYNALGITPRVKFHPLTFSIELVPGLLTRKTRGKHFDEGLSVFGILTALDTFSIQYLGTFFHPGSRVAAVSHYVEVQTFEVPLVEVVDILKF